MPRALVDGEGGLAAQEIREELGIEPGELPRADPSQVPELLLLAVEEEVELAVQRLRDGLVAITELTVRPLESVFLVFLGSSCA